MILCDHNEILHSLYMHMKTYEIGTWYDIVYRTINFRIQLISL